MPFDFPNNPVIGDTVKFPNSTQQYVWNGNAWDGAPLSAQFVTGSGGGSSVSASHALDSDTSISASYATTASHLIGYEPVVLSAGPGVSIDGYKISASVLTVNGSFPDADGNISTALTNVITGTSASLEVSASGAITSSLTVGDVWVISGDTDPSQNGVSYIYSFDDSIGSWLKLSSLDTVTADNRYLMLTPQSPLAGPLETTWGVTGSLLGHADTATSASYALSASYVHNATPSPQTGYILCAYSNAAYNLPNGYAPDLCRYNVVDFTRNVPAGWFNTSTYRFTPQKAGYWRIDAAYDVFRGGDAETSIAIRKNGTDVSNNGAFGSVVATTTRIVYFNGTTDWVDVLNVGAGSVIFRGQSQQRSYFQAEFVSE